MSDIATDIPHAEIARYPASLQSAARAVFAAARVAPRTPIRVREQPAERPRS
jgi:hypothetical protein